MQAAGVPLAERDPNISGRSSRASNFSIGSKGGQRQRRPSHPSHHGAGAHISSNNTNRLDLSTGVMGMLRTTMEIGDVGSLAISSGRNSGYHHQRPNRRTGNASRMSTGSAPSQSGTRNSRHQNWPSMSSAGPQSHRSITSNITAPPYFEPMPPAFAGALDSPTVSFGGGPRSYSMTHTTSPPFGFATHRSFTSLRSHEPFPRPRSPYRYPTRLKRPGYRPSSPALSDVTGLQPSRFHYPPKQSQQSQGGSRLKPPLGDYGRDRSHHQALNSTIPPAGRQNHPYPTARNRSAPTASTLSSRAQRGGPFPLYRGDDSPSTSEESMRNRSSATPSPDPPSSNPPTPRDIAQMVAPIAVGGNSLLLNMKAPAAPGPIYYDYSEDYHSLEKEVTEVFSETLPDSPMPMGFVQRIKALLEEREKAVGGQCLAPMNNPSTPRKSQHDLTVPEIAELPATPVARRITREMILAIMSPSSGLDAGMDSSLQVQADDSYSTPIVERILAPTPESSTPALTEDGESPRSRSRSVASKISVGMKTTAAIDMMEPTTRLGPSNRPQSMHSLASGMDIFIPDEPAETSLPPIRTPTPTPVPSVGLSRVLIDENEPIAERIKRHWSIRRAAAGPLRSQSAYIPGAMPVLPGRLAVPSRQFSWPVAELEGNPKGDIASSGHARRASGPLIIEPGWSPTVPVEHREQAGDKSASWCPVSPMDPDFASHAHMSPVSPPNTTLELISPAPRSSVNTTTTHLSALWSYRRPVPSNSVSSTGANEMPARKEPGHENIAADLRFSMMRSATGQLADVKEEPGLESSMDLRNSTFQFPLPRSGAVKGPFEEVRLAKTVCGSKGSKDSKDSKISSQMTRDSKFSQISQVSKLSNGSSEQRRHSSSDSPIEPPPRAISSVFKQSSTALADTRAIPSLNFSSINLLARLNEALGERRASLGSEFSDLVIATPTPDRHVSSGVMREKYRSFFKTLDDMTGAAIPDDYEAESQLQDHAEERAEEDTIVDTSNVEGNVGEERVSVYVPILRPMSPDELMEEVNRISVPSITGLTQRLSELLPSLRRYFGDTGDVVYVRDPLKETIDEIRGLGRISAGEDINTEGEDGWKSSQSRMVDELRHDDGDTGVGDAVGETDVSEEGNCVVLNVNTDTRRTPNPRNAATRPFSVPSPGIAELEGSIPSPLRLRSLSDSDIDSPAVDRLVTLAHTSRRSLLSNPSDIRPWNHDRNYPWSDGMPAIDIEFPSSALRRDVVGHRPSKLRLRLSSSEHSMSPSPNGIGGPLTSNPPTIASSNDTVPAAITHRRMSKHSVLGSISRKLLHTSPGNTLTNGSSSAASPVDHSGFLNGPDLLRGEERTVDPGDRYPTTGLSPPSHLINMDEVQSFFSDDSSATGRDRRNGQRKRGNSFRKRFTTGLRGRLPGGQHPRAVRERPATACEALHRVNHHPPEASHESLLVPSREGATSAGAAGMSRTEFRAKKLVDKLKVLLWRGGELLRTMSGRRKNNHGLDGTEEEGWSEIGASGLDLFEAPEYDAGATVMSDGIGSRHDSAIATNMMVVNTTAVKDPIAAE